ncbi:TFIIH basal transcription factor complex helicase-like protein XPB subunit [Aulographum hederae CBS 113979]|uniref:DNA 3'-5' helicase n=1 Tax=Aulographum hederae CBS 113979 TaxID=1176131 RepID=A0A6G1HD10_9PEZI|nr:TFIIH basal transcription factor complex helicase-like protein XPB subunit [Aulographum hederae CBS 113979]
MPPVKRKRAPAAAAATPMTVDSDEEYTEDGAAGNSDDENMNRLTEKFSMGTYARKKKPTASRDPVSHLFKNRDFSDLELKPDHEKRPLWIEPYKGRIILESFNPLFKLAEGFLIEIAEPQSRVSRIHEYTITAHSLFAAVSIGLTTSDIIYKLDQFSKTPLPDNLRNFIIQSTKSFGKVRLVLKHTKYYLESQDPAVLQKLLRDPVIGPLRIDEAEGFTKEKAPKMGGVVIPGTKTAAGAKEAVQQPDKAKEDDDAEAQAEQMTATLLEEDDDDEEQDQVHSFEIHAQSVEAVSKRCRHPDVDLPLTEEYDFNNDDHNANLEIDLKPAAQIRPYQEQALSKMFGNGRARSGIIVLPCGAGKTLVGITAACTVRKGVIVLCTSAMSVNQWKDEFVKWSNVNPDDIARFTADKKDQFTGNTGIVISTYSMVTQSKNRSHDSQKVMNFIEEREWGLMVLDEVHVVPAEMFKKVTYKIKAHSKLGLTATLLREDDKIQELNFLIGPKLYEANWQELSEQGHIAKVQCAEVWCSMTTEFYTEYLRQGSTTNKRGLLFTMNPKKFQACQYLIDYHEKRGDKIIVFSDNVYALKSYAVKLGKAFIYGETPNSERERILQNFKQNPAVNTIFLSKIGDTSLDLPEATCLIQISSHYGSRRQEAQRLGRILRAKRRNQEGFNAFFYSLVSKDTNEMYYSSKRQAFLVDQGYAFKVITHLQDIENFKGLAFSTAQERRELLQDVMLQSETAGEEEKIEGDLFSQGGVGRMGKGKRVKRAAGTLSELSGGRDMAYIEYNKSRNKELKKSNAFISKIKRTAARDRQKMKEVKDMLG